MPTSFWGAGRLGSRREAMDEYDDEDFPRAKFLPVEYKSTKKVISPNVEIWGEDDAPNSAQGANAGPVPQQMPAARETDRQFTQEGVWLSLPANPPVPALRPDLPERFDSPRAAVPFYSDPREERITREELAELARVRDARASAAATSAEQRAAEELAKAKQAINDFSVSSCRARLNENKKYYGSWGEDFGNYFGEAVGALGGGLAGGIAGGVAGGAAAGLTGLAIGGIGGAGAGGIGVVPGAALGGSIGVAVGAPRGAFRGALVGAPAGAIIGNHYGKQWGRQLGEWWGGKEECLPPFP